MFDQKNLENDFCEVSVFKISYLFNGNLFEFPQKTFTREKKSSDVFKLKSFGFTWK